MKGKFKIGDLVSKNHDKSPPMTIYTGVVLEKILQEHLSYARAPIYKVMWDHGEWMYEVEEGLRLEVRVIKHEEI